jgi:hypothetical protein
MTKIFYWHLVEFTLLKEELIKKGIAGKEIEEILIEVEEIIHHKTLSLIFDHLPKQHHREFAVRLANDPRDSEILVFLHQKSGTDVAKLLAENIRLIVNEILEDLRIFA